MRSWISAAERSDPYRRGQRNVLVVEDESELREELVELVELLGMRCYGASGLSEALACAAGRPLDVVLCDFNLGAESGLDLLRHLHRAGGAGRRPHLILMTGHTELTDAAYAAIDRYADSLILKPISIDRLRLALAADQAEESIVAPRAPTA